MSMVEPSPQPTPRVALAENRGLSGENVGTESVTLSWVATSGAAFRVVACQQYHVPSRGRRTPSRSRN